MAPSSSRQSKCLLGRDSLILGDGREPEVEGVKQPGMGPGELRECSRRAAMIIYSQAALKDPV